MNNITCGLIILDKKSQPVSIPLTGVKVTGDILGRGAKITVSQRFNNQENKPIEAVYRFPLPEGAAVSNFKALINDRIITGRIEGREKAFEIYDDALTQGHGAYLMDQERPNIFTLSVGNLNPDTEAIIEIEYVQLLDMEGPQVRFSLPTTISPRYMPAGMEEPEGIPEGDRIHPEYASNVPYGLNLSLRILNENLSLVESPTHPISINMQSDPATVSLTSDSVRMDRDFILYLGLPETFQGRGFSTRLDKDAFIQLDLLLDPEKSSPSDDKKSEENNIPSEVVFLVDCSGSMHGDSIREAKKALEICVRALDPDSFFNIVCFGSDYESLFNSPQEYSKKRLSQALSYIKNMNSDLGGTEIYSPLEHVLTQRPSRMKRNRNVILITDGEVGNEAQVMKLIRFHNHSFHLFSIGIGAGCNEYFIKGMARAGLGVSEFIYPGERIEPKVLRIFQKVSDQIITDLKVSWPSKSGTQSPAQPSVFLDSPTSLFLRAPSESLTGKAIQIQGDVNGQKLTWEFAVTETDQNLNLIPLLWARARIRDLEEGSDETLRPGSQQSQRKKKSQDTAILSLSKEFGILSSLSSFVAVEEREEKDKTTGQLQLRKVPVPVTVGWHGRGSAVGHQASIAFSMQIDTLSMELQESDATLCREISYETSNRIMPPTKKHSMQWNGHHDSDPTVDGLDETDLVLAILATQKADGGMELTEDLAELLSIDYREFKLGVQKLAVSDTSIDAFTLASTAVLLTILETRFASQRRIWSKVIRKSRKWMKKIISLNDVSIGDKDLTTWIDELLNP